MKLILDRPELRVYAFDDGLIQVEDRTGFIFTNMAAGPSGSKPGDSIRAMVYLPGVGTSDFSFKQQVVFWLGRSLPSQGYIPSRAHGGDSLVTISESVRIEWPTTKGPTIRTWVFANENGLLSGVGCHLNEESAEKAEQHAYHFLNAVLSTVAFEYRVPVSVQRVEVVDVSGDLPVYYISLGKSFTPVNWNPKESLPTPRLLVDNTAWRRALAFYRESLVLNLPMYRFLAIYKGLEDLGRVRASLYKLARQKGMKAKLAPASLPEDQYFRYIFPNLAGKPVSEGEKHLESGFRNFTAHSILHDGSYVTSDSRYGMINYANLCSLADATFRSHASAIKTFAESLA